MLNGAKLAGSSPALGREKDDFYATDPATVRLFFDQLYREGFQFDEHDWWEPACGNGNICKVINEYRQGFGSLTASDIVDRGWKENFTVRDFLSVGDVEAGEHDVIITNPPFALLKEFMEQGLRLTRRYLMLFCKIQALEGKSRAHLLQGGKLRAVYVHSSRQNVWRNGQPLNPQGKRWATTMCMAWLMFDKSYCGECALRFL